MTTNRFAKTVNRFGDAYTGFLAKLQIKEWDESKHPRDEHGHFTSTGGGGAASLDALGTAPVSSSWIEARAALRESTAVTTPYQIVSQKQTYETMALRAVPAEATLEDDVTIQAAAERSMEQSVAVDTHGAVTLTQAEQLSAAWGTASTTEPALALQHAVEASCALSGSGPESLKFSPPIPFAMDSKADVASLAQPYITAQYQHTQDTLDNARVDQVTLYRGIGFAADQTSLDPFATLPIPSASPGDGQPGPKTANPVAQLYSERPLASWSTDPAVALSYANGPEWGHDRAYVLSTTVPAERVFSTGFSGMGNFSLSEFILLGGDIKVGVVRTR